MGFGKHVLAVELFKNLYRGLFRHAIVQRALEKPVPVEVQQRQIPSPDEGAAQPVGLHGAKSGHVHGQLIHLVLKKNDTQGASQGSLLQGMVELPRLMFAMPLDELAYAVIGADAGAHRRHLVGHFSEVSGQDAGHSLHLRRRLHLEYPHGIGLVQHGIHRRVVVVDATQVVVLAGSVFNQLEGFLHLGEGSQGQKVYFDKARRLNGILVPLANVPALDGPRLHRHHVDQRG